ncbi:hypothetical protein [Longivirga aurantiaca]|uniref:Uncharacterized protein n=1 Tax=Longivirga aurantiaca TaxID=1837743 RepID=A0ABW1T346_9ACTN
MTDPTKNHTGTDVPETDGLTPAEQPEPEASSDGDGSWTADPQTQDPDEDRSVDAVIRRTSRED